MFQNWKILFFENYSWQNFQQNQRYFFDELFFFQNPNMWQAFPYLRPANYGDFEQNLNLKSIFKPIRKLFSQIFQIWKKLFCLNYI